MSNSHESNPSPADPPPQVRLVQGQEVNLGCGTLILIALIVLIFGRSRTGDLEQQLRETRSEIKELRQSIEAQTVQIKSLQDTLTKGNE